MGGEFLWAKLSKDLLENGPEKVRRGGCVLVVTMPLRALAMATKAEMGQAEREAEHDSERKTPANNSGAPRHAGKFLVLRGSAGARNRFHATDRRCIGGSPHSRL